MTDAPTDTLVDGRYRILGRIGSGGMAEVFRAEDTHLAREVALKMLHRRFAQDAEFVERFRREASSAAGLQHPHVVNVFDRGEHDGTYYIAMEHLGGRTLKDVIGAEAPLAQERAIDFGIQILGAAGFAHRQGVIHRDFKSQNVMVDDNDNVKVTDFGIARAGESEMTETGSILGTAQYLSPEQAQGHGVGTESDLYSIGVMLYEALAGRLPFDGHSAVAVAVKHVSEQPAPLSSLRPDIHPALEAAVMRALMKNPAERWGSADEFMAALQAARAAIAMGDEGQGTAIWAPLQARQVEEARADSKPSRRRRWLALLLLLLLAGGAAAFFLLRAEQVQVPDLIGEPLAQAQPALQAQGFEVEVAKETDPATLNEVIGQEPTGGAEVDEGSTVTLTVSSGPGTKEVPDVAGLTESEATEKLDDAGFTVTSLPESSSEVAEGLAIRTLPVAGTKARRGSRVTLYLSSGPEEVKVPAVVGLTRAAAEAQLAGDELEVSVSKVAAEEPKDEVVSQSPTAGTKVEEGSIVTLSVSTGEGETASVPDVSGLPESRARRELQRAGFAARTQEVDTRFRDEDGVVVRQSPGSGAELRRGGTVVIFVGNFTGRPDDFGNPNQEPPPAPGESP